MASRRLRYLQRSVCIMREHFDPFCSPHLPISVLDATTIIRRPASSSSATAGQNASTNGSRWHELPPVPKSIPMRSAWKLKCEADNNNLQTVTALSWVAQCCPGLPRALLHKLFRVRQVRQKALSPSSTSSQLFNRETSTLDAATSRMRRVSGQTVLSEGTVLCLPKSVSLERDCSFVDQAVKKTQHQPTASQVAWLQSLVMYRDAEILVINKPHGLPVQGGSDVGRSLDSLMGKALSFEFQDGPRLVHRLDRETSGVLVLARSRESAMLLHALFRQKTATAGEDKRTTIERTYWALVVGIPKQSHGRITAPVSKVILDNGRTDKIVVAHDISSKDAQLAITDYKVTSSTRYGCTWLELQPVTGRKHQLRVHCAEVLGTPILGDSKYDWRTQKDWLEKVHQFNSQLVQHKPPRGNTSAASQTTQHNSEKGSIFSTSPALHLHCREMAFPNVVRMLERHRAGLGSKEMSEERLQFVATLPPHMVASRAFWELPS